jgi:hypothetical protein
VDPARRIRPLRSVERFGPDREGRRRVERLVGAAQLADRAAGARVHGGQRLAAVGRGTVGRVRPKRQDEFRQVVRRRGPALDRRFAVEPGVHRPRPRVALGGFAERDDGRNRHSQSRERAQDAAFLRDVAGAARGERAPDRPVVTQAVHGVDRAAGSQGCDRQACPFGEWGTQQPADETGVDGVLVGVHPAHTSTEPPASTASP